jgi:hypothetical protein
LSGLTAPVGFAGAAPPAALPEALTMY